MNTQTAIALTSPIASPYRDSWEGDGWADVQRTFHMEEPKPEEILLANYSRDGCDGRAQVLYRNGSAYFYVSGSHCSCFGLEDQWEPEEYTLETLIGALERSIEGGRGFCGSEDQTMLPMLRRRLTRSRARMRARERTAIAA